MSKKLTEAKILEACRAAQGLGKTQFAHELGMSKQSYSAYVTHGAKQDLSGLQEAAIEYVGRWIGDLAVDLLKARDAVVPCVCQTALFDNGQCPNHGKAPLKVAGKDSKNVYLHPILEESCSAVTL